LNSNAIDEVIHVTVTKKQDTRESRNLFSLGLGNYYYLIPDFKDVMLEPWCRGGFLPARHGLLPVSRECRGGAALLPGA